MPQNQKSKAKVELFGSHRIKSHGIVLWMKVNHGDFIIGDQIEFTINDKTYFERICGIGFIKSAVPVDTIDILIKPKDYLADVNFSNWNPDKQIGTIYPSKRIQDSP